MKMKISKRIKKEKNVEIKLQKNLFGQHMCLAQSSTIYFTYRYSTFNFVSEQKRKCNSNHNYLLC